MGVITNGVPRPATGARWRATTAIVATLTVVAALAALVGPHATVGADRAGLPDLVVEELYNVTEMIVGDNGYVNVTLKNQGSAAYLTRSSGELEVYAYRDAETSVAAYGRVYEDIYVGKNLTLNLQVRFDTVGAHELKVVIDELGRVQEESESNNEAVVGLEVLPSGVNRPPVADGGNDRTGHMGSPMIFSGIYSTDPDGDKLTYTWDFGDGQSGSGVRTNHTYAKVSNYTASLTVSDGELSDRDSFTVEVIKAPVNHPPTAVIGPTQGQVEAGRELTLDGSGSSDPDAGDRLVSDWDFNASDGVDDWVRGPVVVATWTVAGRYEVTLRVSDGKASDEATVVVDVTVPPPPNKPPRASAGTALNATSGERFTIRGTGADEDGHIAVYEWDTDSDGTYDTYSEQDGMLIWSFDEPGEYTIRLRVTDDRGSTDTSAVTVTVRAPESEGEPSPGVEPAMILLAVAAAAIVLGLAGWRWRQSRT